MVKMKLFFCITILQFPLQLYSQRTKDPERLRYRPGICIEKNVVDINSFEFGANLIATHGRLKNNVINYYGFEVSYTKITLINHPSNGVVFRLMYQYVKHSIGFNLQSSVLFANNAQFFRPEIGINYFGIISLNYGYYFRLDTPQTYDISLHHLSLKLSLNLSYGEYLNIVGKSSKKW
jgi:hypothetical protein